MTNHNQKYRNGLAKRAAVQTIRADLARRGALTTMTTEASMARFGGRPSFILDTNVFFATIEYWADELRRGLRELCAAQPSLRLYLLDTVASECRGRAEKRRRYETIVWSGANLNGAVIHPLSTDRADVAALSSQLAARLAAGAQPLSSPSFRKDILIAAAASVYGMTIVTANGGDFSRIAAVCPDLRVAVLSGPAVEAHAGERLLEMLAAPYLSACPDQARMADLRPTEWPVT